MPDINLGTLTAKGIIGKSDITLGLVLPQLSVKANLNGLKFAEQDNISGGIVAYKTGNVLDVDISGGIYNTLDVDIKGGIASEHIDPPSNPLAVHIGQGAVAIQWTPPQQEVDHYEIWGSSELNGNYFIVSSSAVGKNYILQNVPVGNHQIYLQIRSVHKSGLNSSFVQIKRGKIEVKSVKMFVQGIDKIQIPADTTFSSIESNTGQLVSFKSDRDVVLSDGVNLPIMPVKVREYQIEL